MTTRNPGMHYRVLLHVRTATSVVVALEDETGHFGHFYVSLGVNARSPSEALTLAESHVVRAEDDPVVVSYVEIEALALEAVPLHVIQAAFRDPSEPGVYWQSGRVFGQDQGEEGA
jgi:hypothetical protein